MLTAEQVQRNVPIFNILAEGEDVGTITNFPGEGVVYTLRVLDVQTTNYTCKTIHGALEHAREAYLQILAGKHDAQQYVEEDYIEDEDGELARMRHAEDEAERWAMSDPAWGYPEGL